jgi:hypothetical protein
MPGGHIETVQIRTAIRTPNIDKARAIAQTLGRGKLVRAEPPSDQRFDQLCVELRALIESRAGCRRSIWLTTSSM